MNRMDMDGLDEEVNQQKFARGEDSRRRTGRFPRRVWRSVLLVHGAAEGALERRKDEQEKRGEPKGFTSPDPLATGCGPFNIRKTFALSNAWRCASWVQGEGDVGPPQSRWERSGLPSVGK